MGTSKYVDNISEHCARNSDASTFGELSYFKKQTDILTKTCGSMVKIGQADGLTERGHWTEGGEAYVDREQLSRSSRGREAMGVSTTRASHC